MGFKKIVLDAVDEFNGLPKKSFCIDKGRIDRILSLSDTFDAFIYDIDDGLQITDLYADINNDGRLVVEIQSITVETRKIDLFASICELADRLEFEVFDKEYVSMTILFSVATTS